MPRTRPEKLASRTLATTLVLAFFGTGLSILVISSALQVYFTIASGKKELAARQELVAANAAAVVEEFLDERFAVLETAAHIGPFAAGSEPERRLAFAKLLGKEASIRQIAFFDASSSSVIQHARFASEIADLFPHLDPHVFKPAGQMGRSISSVYIDEVTSEPLVTISVPVRDTLGDMRGVLAAEVKLKFMWDLIADIRVGESGYAYVVNRDGYLIAHRDASRVVERENVSGIEAVKHYMLGIPSQVGTDRPAPGIEGRDVISAYKPLGSPDWAVIVEQPVTESYAEIYRLLQLSIGIALALLILGAIIAIVLAKKITEPIVELRNAAVKISQGELGVRIAVPSRNEIGQLGLAFNEMARRVQETHLELERNVRERTKALVDAQKELSTANVGLEEKVVERTKELEAVKANLETIILDRTVELQTKLAELEQVNKFMVGRELKMIELKKLLGDDDHAEKK